MTTPNRYLLEHALVVGTLLASVAGFWKLYVGADAAPNGFHHLHVVANFAWLLLLLWQLRLVATRQFADHRKAGLCVLVAGPLLFASAALLSVHSAHKGVVSGEGDFLIVQNVMGTLQIGLMIGLALIQVGVEYAAGGVALRGQPAYGSLENWSVAMVVIGVTFLLLVAGHPASDATVPTAALVKKSLDAIAAWI